MNSENMFSFTFCKLYFVDLAFWHHRPPDVFSHSASRSVWNICWRKLQLKNTNALSKTLTIQSKITTDATFVMILRSLAASAWELRELFSDVSMANASLYERGISAARPLPKIIDRHSNRKHD